MDMKYYDARLKPEQVLAAFAKDVSGAGAPLTTKLGRGQDFRGFTSYPFWAVIQGISGKWLFAGRMVLYEDNWTVSFQVFQGGRQRPPTGTPVDIRKALEGDKMTNKQAGSDPKYQDYVERKKKDGEKPLPREEWEVKVLGKEPETESSTGMPQKDQDEIMSALSKAIRNKRVWDATQSQTGKPRGTGGAKDAVSRIKRLLEQHSKPGDLMKGLRTLIKETDHRTDAKSYEEAWLYDWADDFLRKRYKTNKQAFLKELDGLVKVARSVIAEDGPPG